LLERTLNTHILATTRLLNAQDPPTSPTPDWEEPNYPYWPNTDSIYYRFVIDSESNTGGPFSTSGTVWYP